jgi:L-2-hydroxyglutarate oxidase LhgO
MRIGIIGSGVVGLTLAYEIVNYNPEYEITIFEKEDNSIRHGTGRNSGVIHSGIYYTPNSLRSDLCIEGSRLMKKFIQDHKLYLNPCGKLLMPRYLNDLESLDILFERSKKVGVHAIKLNSKEEILKIEPNCNPIFNQALFIKDTAIGDPKEVSAKLLELLNQCKVSILYHHEVSKVISNRGAVYVKDALFEFDLVINAAGLYADRIAEISNLKTNYSSLPFKGKYWSVKTTNSSDLPKTLLYPVPNLVHPFLGIHTVYDKSGNFYLGPSSTPVFGKEAYKPFQKFKLIEFVSLVLKFFTKIFTNENKLRNLAISEFRNLFLSHIKKSTEVYFKKSLKVILKESKKVGIRSQIFDKKSKTLYNDFVVIKQNKTVHILNAISPAWTSSFAMAKYINSNFIQSHTQP